MDRGLVPLLSKKTAKSLATNWQNKKLQRGSLIRLPSQRLPFFQPAMSSVGLDITADKYPGLHPLSTQFPMHSLGMSTVASVPAALAHSIYRRPHTSPLSPSMADLPTHSNSWVNMNSRRPPFVPNSSGVLAPPDQLATPSAQLDLPLARVS